MDQSYKFRIYPTDEQRTAIAKAFGCARWIYNHFLTISENAIESGKSRPSIGVCNKEITKLKRTAGTEWLAEPDKYAVANALKDLDRAYQNHFSNPAHFKSPVYKSKKNPKQSYRTCFVAGKKNGVGNIEVDNGKQMIKLPKLKWIKASVFRQLEGRIINATVSRTATDEYYVSITCRDVMFEQYEPTDKRTGIDMGLTELMTLSDGEVIPNNKRYRTKRRKLANAQRALSRKVKGSNNYKKQKRKIARIHRDITNQRNDDIHKARVCPGPMGTTKIVKEYGVIAIEDLGAQNMAKNHNLAGTIYDAAWREIRRQLEYKCKRHGRELLVVPRLYASTQTCSVCGHRTTETKGLEGLKVRKWICPHCGTELDRDINAAVNILNEALEATGVEI